MLDYKLFQSNYVVDNQQSFIEHCDFVKLQNLNKDLTKSYYEYNIFSATAGSLYFYNLFKELRDIIRTELPTGPLWMQAWLNYHTQEQVLDWHNHDWEYHGYISIDPKITFTEFENYSVENKVGQIYFGPGRRLHRVKTAVPFDDHRITIGYDITADPIMGTGCQGMLPLL